MATTVSLNFRELVPSPELSAELTQLINLCLPFFLLCLHKKIGQDAEGLGFKAGSINIVNHQGIYFSGLV